MLARRPLAAFPAPADSECCGDPVLVLCPGAVVTSWREAFENWTWLEVGCLGVNERETVQHRERILRRAAKGELHVVVVTHHLALVQETVTALLAEQRWGLLVIDEIHILRNHTTAMYNTLKMCIVPVCERGEYRLHSGAHKDDV